MNQLLNPVIEVLLNRRSVRKYLSKEVPMNILEVILQAGLYAPTGGNHQYTRFLVTQNPQILKEINDIVKDEFSKRELEEGCYQNKTVVKAKKENYNCMYHAPVLIMAVSPTSHGNSMADCANGLENMQIAAASMGLGACWINQIHWLTDNQRMQIYLYDLGMKTEESVFGVLVLGYPDSDNREKNPERPKRKAGRIVMIQK